MGSRCSRVALAVLLAVCGCDSDSSGTQDAGTAMDAPPVIPDGAVDSKEPDITPTFDMVGDLSLVDTQSSADLGPGCGNGVREPDEQCDDGNQINLDGCDAECRFEQAHRITQMKVQFGTDSFCLKNAFFGAVVHGDIRNQMQLFLKAAIDNGDISLLFKWFDLDDLTGTNDAALEMGLLDGNPVPGPGYNGADNLDWWYTVNPNVIDAQRNPLRKLGGNIVSNVLTAGPGTMAITLNFIDMLASFDMTDVRITIPIGASTTPLVSAGDPPGHLLTENIDPSLASFESMGLENDTVAGKLCGMMTAKSLASIALPQLMIVGCKEGYTINNKMIDVFVGGCSAVGYTLDTVIVPTQPDTDDPNVPPAGAGPPYTLTANAQKVVYACTDKDNNPVSLNGCLMDASYSAYMKFSSQRVIIK